MKVLLVFAHPEPRSLNGALRDVAVKELEAQGHEVLVSDLYADGWNSELARGDFPSLAPGTRFKSAKASGEAFAANGLTADVKAEQEKLLWADTLILQFPLWCFSMPAILKGWVDGSTPMVSPMASANTAMRVGVIAMARGPSQASARC
jgi:NAD(P)H dehydrogenase (quinone)